jgi:L-lactate dehydrogenase
MSKKIVLIGTGFVGMSYIYSAVNQGLASEYVLIDIDKNKTEGEAADMIHAVSTLNYPSNIYSGDYSDCADADIVVITAGAAQKDGETRLELVAKNTLIITNIAQKIEASGFNGIYLIASNPVDILTKVVMDNTHIENKRIIGSGTLLDTSRFKYEISQMTNSKPENIDVMIIGEHGDSSVPITNNGKINGISLNKYFHDAKISPIEVEDAYEKARDAAYNIIKSKNATYYGIGLCLAKISKAILRDEKSILPVSTELNGEFTQNKIVISVPAVIGQNGIEEVVEIELSEDEKTRFNKSCEVIRSFYK